MIGRYDRQDSNMQEHSRAASQEGVTQAIALNSAESAKNARSHEGHTHSSRTKSALTLLDFVQGNKLTGRHYAPLTKVTCNKNTKSQRMNEDAPKGLRAYFMYGVNPRGGTMYPAPQVMRGRRVYPEETVSPSLVYVKAHEWRRRSFVGLSCKRNMNSAERA